MSSEDVQDEQAKMKKEMWWIEEAGDGWWECVRYTHTHLMAISFEPTIDYETTYDSSGRVAIVWVFTSHADELRGEINDVVQSMPHVPPNTRVFMRRENIDFRGGNARELGKPGGGV